MKLLIALLAIAGLSGCVAYGGAPYTSAGVYYSDAPYYGGSYYGGVPYVIDQRPVYIHRGGGHAGNWRNRDIDRDGIPNRVDRDRDGDGIRNRIDRDRDGDGVANRRDSHPNDPRRR